MRIKKLLPLLALVLFYPRVLCPQALPSPESLSVPRGEWASEDDRVIRADGPVHSDNPLYHTPKSPLENDSLGNSSGYIRAVEGIKGAGSAVQFNYTLGDLFEYRYAMLLFKFKYPSDLSSFKTMRFWIKGSGNKIEVNVCADNVFDYDYHAYTLKATPGEWKQVEVPFALLRQGGWGAKVDFDPSRVNKIQFRASSMISDESGYFAVDGLEFSTSSIFADKISGNPFMFSDFEGGAQDRLGDDWKYEDDTVNAGNSKGALSIGGGQGSSKGSLRIEYLLGPAYKFRYASASVEFQKPIDISSYNTVKFRLKGSGNKLKFHVCCSNVKDYDWHGSTIAATPSDWEQYEIGLKSLKQEGWGRQKALDLTKVTRLEYQTGSMAADEHGWFEVDDIIFSK